MFNSGHLCYSVTPSFERLAWFTVRLQQCWIRDAKCHGYDGLIRVKILASWGKSLGEHTILKNEAFFGGDLHNLCEMSLSKLS